MIKQIQIRYVNFQDNYDKESSEECS